MGVNVLMSQGRAAVMLQHRRIREWPPSGGWSVYCEAVPLDLKLAEQYVALLRAMEWDGVAMVEYRYDDATNNAVFMEVNGRFSGLSSSGSPRRSTISHTCSTAVPRIASSRCPTSSASKRASWSATQNGWHRC